MDQERMDRTQFFQKVGALREPELQRVLWDLYWRGKGELKRRIEELLEPAKATPASKRLPELDGASILHEVLRFSGLIVSGAYMGGTREVSRQERSRWRVTFRRHVENAAHLLKQGDLEHGFPALESLIDVLCQMHDYEYVHSEDPVQAAGIVVSDRVELLWRTVLEVQGFQAFTRTAARQLLQWERAYGWTRYGATVAEKERSLATVLAGMLHGADSWTHIADAYLAALDEILRPGNLLQAGPKAVPHGNGSGQGSAKDAPRIWRPGTMNSSPGLGMGRARTGSNESPNTRPWRDLKRSSSRRNDAGRKARLPGPMNSWPAA